MYPSFVDRLRRPEHTGDNRCWPCTAVNLAILGVVAAALALASSVLAAVAAAVGLFVILVRGYLVPGTPRFAPGLVARLPGGEALFHGVDDPSNRQSGSLRGDDGGAETGGTSGDSRGTPSTSAGAGSGPGAGVDPGSDADASRTDDGPLEGDALVRRLVDAGVLDADGETVAPTDAFEARWHAEMAELSGADTEALAEAALEFSPATESHAVRQDGGEWVALSSGAEHAFEETWLNRPVAIAEVGGARAAAEFVDDETALAAAQTCRMFLNACPDCRTELERGTEVDCCGGYNGPNEEPAETLVCPSCEVRLFTFE
ncbi:hypothetical protein [Halobellus sp. EA9]|uniref:hypothetical protein n=1 Tax=Halobellus sp. EA9 TaxID=3421647 RepID=UPI003EB6F656